MRQKAQVLNLDHVYEPQYHVVANAGTVIATFNDRDAAYAWVKKYGYGRVIKTVKEVE